MCIYYNIICIYNKLLTKLCCVSNAVFLVLSAFPFLGAIIEGAAIQPSNSSHH